MSEKKHTPEAASKQYYFAICDAGDQFSVVVSDPNEHAKKAEEATAGHVGFRYIPMERVRKLCFDDLDNSKLISQLKSERDELIKALRIINDSGAYDTTQGSLSINIPALISRIEGAKQR